MMKKPLPHNNKALQCKQCIWFYEKDEDSGLTCKEKYKAKSKDPACMEFDKAPFKPSIIRKSNSFVKKTLKTLEGEKFKIDKTIIDELNSYYIFAKYDSVKKQIKRQVPHNFNAKTMKKITSLLEETQSNRDRVTEIIVSVMGHKNDLEAIEFYATSYIYDNFMNDIKNLSNETMRTNVVKSIYKELYEKISLITYILNVAEKIDSNLSNAYYTLREISTIANNFMDKKRNV